MRQDCGLDYRCGYFKAIIDLARWVNMPNRSLVKRLCTPIYLEAVLNFIAEHADEFMASPDDFPLNYEIERKRLKLWLNDEKDAPDVARAYKEGRRED